MGYGLPVWRVEGSWFFQEQHAAFHQATLAWIRSLGLDPDRLAPTAVVVPYKGVYELHVDEIVRDDDSRDLMDPLTVDKLLTVRRIVPVEEGSWPPKPETPAERI